APGAVLEDDHVAAAYLVTRYALPEHAVPGVDGRGHGGRGHRVRPVLPGPPGEATDEQHESQCDDDAGQHVSRTASGRGRTGRCAHGGAPRWNGASPGRRARDTGRPAAMI